MTLAVKYNEAMEHLRLTEEARARILGNVSKAMQESDGTEKTAKIIRFQNRKRWGALAACLAVVLLGALVFKPGQNVPGNNDTQVTVPGSQVMLPTGIEEYASVEALSEALGFPVEDAGALPLAVDEIHYEIFFGEVAQITVLSGEQYITFRKASGTADVSGDYENYSVVTEENLSGVSVTLKGSEAVVSLAVWQDAGYAYSLSVEPSASAEAIKAMVDSIIKQ